jgi:hypothetical protein
MANMNILTLGTGAEVTPTAAQLTAAPTTIKANAIAGYTCAFSRTKMNVQVFPVVTVQATPALNADVIFPKQIATTFTRIVAAGATPAQFNLTLGLSAPCLFGCTTIRFIFGAGDYTSVCTVTNQAYSVGSFYAITDTITSAACSPAFTAALIATAVDTNKTFVYQL